MKRRRGERMAAFSAAMERAERQVTALNRYMTVFSYELVRAALRGSGAPDEGI